MALRSPCRVTSRASQSPIDSPICNQSARCDLRPTRLMSGVAHLRRFHGLLWDPYAYPYSVDCRHPRAAHDIMFNGSAEYATAPNGTRKRSDGALKNRWGATPVRVQFPGPVLLAM